MRVIPLQADVPAGADEPAQPQQIDAFAQALDGVQTTLATAQRAEDRFGSGSGSLVDAAYERARADVAVSVAAATASHVVQTVQSLLNMQV